MLGDESDGFLVLEKAIADVTELDNDLLDKILESMEKKEVSKDEEKLKKKNVKKARGRASISVEKGSSN